MPSGLEIASRYSIFGDAAGKFFGPLAVDLATAKIAISRRAAVSSSVLACSCFSSAAICLVSPTTAPSTKGHHLLLQLRKGFSVAAGAGRGRHGHPAPEGRALPERQPREKLQPSAT